MTRTPKNTASYPNLYLLGFMGTGKSSVGRKIAARLGMRFLDSDAEIEKSAGMEIKDIFAKFGEERFREMERKFIESGHPDSGCVVSCGGGLCFRDGMPELLRGKGVCVVLFSTPEEICERGFEERQEAARERRKPHKQDKGAFGGSHPLLYAQRHCHSRR